MTAQYKLEVAQDYLDHAFDDDRTKEEGMTLAVGSGLIAAAAAMLELAGALKESDAEIDTWSKELHTKIPDGKALLTYMSGLEGRAVLIDTHKDVWVLTGDDTTTYVADLQGNGIGTGVWVGRASETHMYPFTILDGMDAVTAAERLVHDGTNQ